MSNHKHPNTPKEVTPDEILAYVKEITGRTFTQRWVRHMRIQAKKLQGIYPVRSWPRVTYMSHEILPFARMWAQARSTATTLRAWMDMDEEERAQYRLPYGGELVKIIEVTPHPSNRKTALVMFETKRHERITKVLYVNTVLEASEPE